MSAFLAPGAMPVEEGLLAMSDGPVLHLFGGKGGAGKTTLATAFALNLIEESPKDRVLLTASDTAEALSDFLKKKLSAKPTKLVPGKGNGGLFVQEFVPGELQRPFVAEFQAALKEISAKGAIWSEGDFRVVFGIPTTGLEELLGLLRAVESLEDGSYERIVLDLAPTSHALRLLDAAPALKKALAAIRGSERIKGKKEAPPREFFDTLSARLDRLSAFLRDPSKTAFHLIALAEPVSETQTRQLCAQLKERGIPVSELVVNQVEERNGCPACLGRRGLQAPHVRKFQQIDKGLPVALVGRRELAPRGLEAARKLAKEWSNGKESGSGSKTLDFQPSEGPPALVRAPSMPPIAAPPLPPTRLIFFVGQGGVGKSSCAAAAAVTLTEKEGPVLLISTEASHSLSDVLQSRLTDTETQVKGTKGLYARELDATGWFNTLRRRWKEKAEAAFDSLPRGDAPADREVLKNLLELVPSGFEEFAGLAVLTDALIQERFKRIVVDTLPTSPFVRLTDVAGPAKSWLTALHAVLSKYRAKGLGDLTDDVAGLLRHVKRFEEALASPAESRFVVVTRGEDLAAARTERLVQHLQVQKRAVERVLVNRVLPKSTCEKCENRRKLELTAAKNVEKKLGLPVTVAPALGRHPAGLRELKAFRTAWYALSATAKIKAA